MSQNKIGSRVGILKALAVLALLFVAAGPARADLPSIDITVMLWDSNTDIYAYGDWYLPAGYKLDTTSSPHPIFLIWTDEANGDTWGSCWAGYHGQPGEQNAGWTAISDVNIVHNPQQPQSGHSYTVYAVIFYIKPDGNPDHLNSDTQQITMP